MPPRSADPGFGRHLEYYDHVRGGTVEFTYNMDGEIVEKTFNSTTEAQYTYDSRGFLESVTLGSGTIAYVLDGQGRRVAREENGVVKDRFLYKDFINPVAWQDAGGSVAYFVYGGRGHVPDWMVKGGAYYRFVTDHLGSVRRVVNVETGTVAQAVIAATLPSAVAPSMSPPSTGCCGWCPFFKECVAADSWLCPNDSKTSSRLRRFKIRKSNQPKGKLGMGSAVGHHGDTHRRVAPGKTPTNVAGRLGDALALRGPAR